MASLEEIRNNRLEKLNYLLSIGVDPYPTKVKKDYDLLEVVKNFSKISKSKKLISVVGRIKSIRKQGAIIFFDAYDGTDKLQALLKKGEKIKDTDFDLFEKVVDIGDFVSIRGTLFLTKRKEKTLQVSSWQMASKSLRPLPEKWHGLQDIEERFRRRYLDLLMNNEVKERMIFRVKMIEEIRNFYNQNGFIEVEVPQLQPLAGGALAKPFKTHHNTLDTDFFLPIAQELYLKMLLVGGFTKVFELGRRFRNEGIATTHNPEFTMLESNEAYADANDQRDFIEKLFKYVVKKMFGKMVISYDGQKIDFSKKFNVITFYDLLKRYAHIPNPHEISKEDAIIRAKQLNVDVDESDFLENILDNIYKKTCRSKLIQPTFITDYPVSMNPFAKRKEDNPSLIDRFQLVIAGAELVNAFSELNNPIDQKERYLEEDQKGKRGSSEISPSDQEYLEAMEYGMPPNGGIGIGIDRMAMILTDTKNIKEIILFPTLKPKIKENHKKEE